MALAVVGCKDPDDPKPDPENPSTHSDWPSTPPECDAFTDQIVDGGFETQWYQPQDAEYLEYKSSVFYTLNSLITLKDIPAMQVVQAPITAQLDSVTPHGGNYAIKLVTGSLVNAANGRLLVPGAIAPLNQTFVNEFLNSPDGINVKRPYTQKPIAISGYFKYESVNGDSASVCVELYDADKQVIARGYHLQKNSVNTWTQFNVPIDYTVSGGSMESAVPAYISIIISASAGYDFSELTNCRGQDGSALWIDDLELHFR